MKVLKIVNVKFFRLNDTRRMPKSNLTVFRANAHTTHCFFPTIAKDYHLHIFYGTK